MIAAIAKLVGCLNHSRFYVLFSLVWFALDVHAGLLNLDNGESNMSDSLLLVAYNVENFFDAEHDTLKNDYDFLPHGTKRWTKSRFYHKAHHIAKVMSYVERDKMPDVIGLAEVENAHCLRVLCYELRAHRYRYLHYESPDERGVDVALLYNPKRFNLLDSASLFVDLNGDFTRDVLYAKGLLPNHDTLHVYMCHLPSMTGGSSASMWKRDRAKRVIQNHVDSVMRGNVNAQIVVMGDMNGEPKDDLSGLRNAMLSSPRLSTHKYKGIWSCLDQIYYSESLESKTRVGVLMWSILLEEDVRYLGFRPRRTFVGYKYDRKGYSDHLPIVVHMALY